MNTSKIQVRNLFVDLDFLSSGCLSVIAWDQDDGSRQYHVQQNRRFVSVSRYKTGAGWEKIISPDLTANPLNITPEELFMARVVGLNDFEVALYEFSPKIISAWVHKQNETKIKEELCKFVLDYV